MLLRYFYDTKLSQASYLVGCQATGEALVVDPNRDLEQYVRAARSEGLALTHVTETHIHADFVSGSRELAAAAGARLYLSAEGGDDWQYSFAAGANAQLLRDGDRLAVGNLVVEVLHTPGHTPEHLCFMITDGAATDRPMGVFTGDFVFVGDVGRPDLLERAAGVAGTMEAGARQLFASLQRFRRLPDYLQLWPGHGAGSACGKALGAVPSTTLGYERFANWGFAAATEAEFVEQVLAGQPEPPGYFARMKRVNRDGPAARGTPPAPARREPGQLVEALRAGAQVADTRSTREFAGGHVPGTVNMPYSRSFLVYAGSMLSYERPLYLVAADQSAAAGAAADLGLIGMDRVEGWFGPEVLEGAREATQQVRPPDLAGLIASGRATVVDVRGRAEWDAGHISGALHVPMGELAGRSSELPGERQVVLVCETGSRSAVAASVLLAAGRTGVANLAGGMSAWERSGLPIEREAPSRFAR